MTYLPLGVIALTLAAAYGIWYAYAVILVALLAEFGWSRSVLAGAFSLFTVVHGAANPLMGMLCTRFKPLRVMAAGGAAMGLALFADSFIATPLQLYLAFGVATSLAVAAAGWIPALVHVQRHHPERLGLSIGIVSSGVGLGMLLVVPLTQLLIDAFGWRWAFRALGALCVLWIVPASLWLMATQKESGSDPDFRTRPKESGSDPDKAEPGKTGVRPPSRLPSYGMTLRQALGTQSFWLLVASCFFGNVCAHTLHVHQVLYLVDHGFAAIVAASVVGAVGLSSIGGKMGGGWLSDRVERERVFAGGMVVLVASVLLLLALGQSPSQWGTYVYAVLLGIGYSVTATTIPAMVSDRFGGPHIGAILGVALMGSAFGSAFGPWLAGTLYDITSSYTVPFLIAAACGVIAGVSGWRARTLRLRAV